MLYCTARMDVIVCLIYIIFSVASCVVSKKKLCKAVLMDPILPHYHNFRAYHVYVLNHRRKAQ